MGVAPADPVLRHVLDQATGEIGEVAYLVWCYYGSLVDRGFTPDQALHLAHGFQAEAVREAFSALAAGA